MKKVLLPFLLFCGMACIGVADVQEASRWEEAIRSFESFDKKNPPEQVELLFLGSSSIRAWDLDLYFPGRRKLNRGFGGSHISDSLFYAERIVIPYAPETIVFYAGDNDIAAGKNPKAVFNDFKEFVAKVRRHLRDTRIVFISIKPSLKRWHLVERMREANGMIREWSALEAGVEFLDVDSPMLGADGNPRRELFVEDGLHLSPEGYQLWSEALIRVLESERELDGCKSE